MSDPRWIHVQLVNKAGEIIFEAWIPTVAIPMILLGLFYLLRAFLEISINDALRVQHWLYTGHL